VAGQSLTAALSSADLGDLNSPTRDLFLRLQRQGRWSDRNTPTSAEWKLSEACE